MPKTASFVDSLANSRLPDGGPRYVETDLTRHPIVEPFNTVTAIFFGLIALAWLWQLRHKQPNRSLKLASAIILLMGGIGGTIFHGTRSHWFFLMLDVVPIIILIIGYSIHLFYTIKMLPLAAVLVLVVFLLRLSGSIFGISEQAQITLGYGFSGSLILVPLVLSLQRQQWRHLIWVLMALVSFIVALLFRLADSALPATQWISVFWMGTHFLWHTFGALATVLLIIYWYKVDLDKQPSSLQ
jgi:hemolysin III